MPSRKKTKTNSKNALVPKWTSDGLGSYSLVFEPIKSIKPSKETKNNQLKSLKAKKSKKSEQKNADNENFTDGVTFANKLKLEAAPGSSQEIGEKLYEYIVQQNEFANDLNSSGATIEIYADEHANESETHNSQSCNESESLDEGCDESDEGSESDGGSDGSGQCADPDNVDTTAKNDNNANINDDISDSDDDDICDLVNQHFENKNVRPTIVSAQTDTFPCMDDSEPTEKEVKFYIDKGKSTAIAEYDGTEYRIGFLDLTAEEKRCMEMISQSEIYLNFKSNHIMLRARRFNIKRITERVVSPNTEQQPFESMYEQLNLARVQFGTEPFFAKYQNEIYFVGERLYHEYSELLKRTKKCAGTAIRIGHDRLIIDYAMQTLDITDSISFQNQKEICVIPGTFDVYKFHDEYPLTSYHRLMICSNPWTLLEIEPELLHSSIYDDCTEIYADSDFPFPDSPNVEKIVKPATAKKQPTKNEPRYLDEEQLDMQELRSYPVPVEIKEFFIANEKKHRRQKKPFANTKFNGLLNKKTLRDNVEDYVNGSKMMIYLEEEAQAHYLTRFNQSDIKITYHMDRQFYFPVTDDLMELAAAIEENVLDFFILKPKSNRSEQAKHVHGQVQRVRDKKIYIEIFPHSVKYVSKAYKDELYDICFILNRMPYQMQHYALNFIEKEDLFTKLINNSYYHCKSAKLVQANGVPMQRSHSFQKKGTMLEKLNTEQQKAVKNIIEKVDKLPFVLFGPPGTGKTRTLVATIEQIVRTTKQNVLVCAMSNAACDEIAERLIDVLKENEMYRFYAKSYKHERISPRIKGVSNYNRDGMFYPSLSFLYKFRVFICTLCSAGCLTRARKDKEVWRPNHFDYVVIDECASAHETMCLIPIAGLCTSQKQIHAKIVLSGDPKQLDAVTRSDIARGLGFNTSWMERLCSTNLYQRKNGKYNELYIMQLVKNYRSHPEILRIPNELFYENTLKACAKDSDINWYTKSNFMKSNGFPVIFKAVKGECERSLEHSWYNDAEVNEVYNTIKQLLPPNSTNNGLKSITQKDIGVVTPYRKQRHKISQKLRRFNMEDVTVGTAEIFQGKERPIMIISTVRSNGSLGFVSEERRLNVVITRAKALVVIIGDPHTLKLDKKWRRVMEHCVQNKSFIQCNKKFTL